MKLQLILGINSLLVQGTIVTAWTQYQHFGHRLFKSVLLRLRENDDVEVERTRLESLWTLTDEDDFVPLSLNGYEQVKSLPVGEWTEGLENEWADVGPCFGDECDVSRSCEEAE